MKCGHCKQTMDRIADSYVPYSSPEDIEQPDEVFLCMSCHLRIFNNILKQCYNGISVIYLQWRPSLAELKAIKRCGYKLTTSKVGLHEAYRPDNIPKGRREWKYKLPESWDSWERGGKHRK